MKTKLNPDLFYEDANGQKHDDGLHDAMLNDNPEADKAFSEGAIALAMKRGMTEADARKLYGLPTA